MVEEVESPMTDREDEDDFDDAAHSLEHVAELIHTISDRTPELGQLVERWSTQLFKHRELRTAHHRKMALYAVSSVSLIVAVSAWLTYVDKIDGASFTFLLGLVVGHLLSFLLAAVAPGR